MNVARIAGKLREKRHSFSGRLSQGFGKVERRFVHEALYGIQPRQSMRLSEIARLLNEAIPVKKTLGRLSIRLARPGMAQELTDRVMGEGARRVGRDTLLILDPTEIVKPYAEKMEDLAPVRDVTPLYQSLYSQAAPGFQSENTEILEALEALGKHTGENGIWVIDRGKLPRPLLADRHRLIIRMRGDHHVLFRGRARSMLDVARDCPLPDAERIVKESHDEERACQTEYGFRKVRLPGRTEPLYLLVATGFGTQPPMLLTTLELKKNRTTLWNALESYLTRWRIEETIRFIKQSYRLEDVRVLTHERLQNIMALVLAAVCFAAVHFGARAKLEVLATHVLKAAKRIFGIPDFRDYALADGIGPILDRANQGPRPQARHAKGSAQLLLFDFG